MLLGFTQSLHINYNNPIFLFQIVINVVLEKDVTYEVVEENKACHHLRSKNNVFLLRLSQDSNGDQFAVVVRNILRRIQGKE